MERKMGSLERGLKRKKEQKNKANKSEMADGGVTKFMSDEDAMKQYLKEAEAINNMTDEEARLACAKIKAFDVRMYRAYYDFKDEAWFWLVEDHKLFKSYQDILKKPIIRKVRIPSNQLIYRFSEHPFKRKEWEDSGGFKDKYKWLVDRTIEGETFDEMFDREAKEREEYEKKVERELRKQYAEVHEV